MTNRVRIALADLKQTINLYGIKLKLVQLALQSMGARKRRLIIDCGSNLGQGYILLKRYLPARRYDAILVEPNPNCMNVLREKFGHYRNIEFRQSAAWTGNQRLKLFGLVEDNRGLTSKGASVVRNHNSSMYHSDMDAAIEVDAFSLSELVLEKSRDYDEIILKMDIESAEYDVLQDLIDTHAAQRINHLFIEFHSQYFKAPEKSYYEQLQTALVKSFKNSGAGVTIWG